MENEFAGHWPELINLIRRLAASDDAGAASLVVDGVPLRLERRITPAETELVLTPGGGPALKIGTAHRPQGSRPQAYGVDLPFVPWYPMALLMPESEEGQYVVWFSVSDEPRLTATVTDACRRAGWTVVREREAGTSEDIAFRSTFVRGHDERTILTIRLGDADGVVLFDCSRARTRGRQ